MVKKIMIVEDEKAFQDLYKLMFEGRNYDIVYSYDGDDAKKKLEEHKPDLIILDMLLGMVTGDAFFLYIKGMPEREGVVVISLLFTLSTNIKHILHLLAILTISSPLSQVRSKKKSCNLKVSPISFFICSFLYLHLCYHHL